ncbi:hypothetical protein FA13DRAFT_1741305 [Coprinellus micaceus]|uniref:Uncharacterized protein n=1 Tax=Coprinellus micaceus TaxID=71717 RepID=A0A4Y7SJI3_COPMI|nr:hypothetical protein FA13DRAFT_1741305 [Coprinellus micaceus]
MTKNESTEERTDKRTGRANEAPTQPQTEIFADMFRGGYDVNAFEKNGKRNVRNRRAEGRPTQRNASLRPRRTERTVVNGGRSRGHCWGSRFRDGHRSGQNATKIEQVLKNVKRRSPHQLERSRRTLRSLPFPTRPSPNYRQGTPATSLCR